MWLKGTHRDEKLAMLLATTDVEKGSFGLGYINSLHNAFHVLFLTVTPELVSGYRRIGVGALFGRETETGFSIAIERDVWLI